MKNINDLTLDEIREELGTSVYNEELASFIGTRLKINVSNIQVLDLINYLINNQDILIDYANKYLLYSQAKKEFKEYLLNKYKVILNMGGLIMNYNQEQTFNNYELEDIKDIIGVDAYYQALQEFAKKELRRGEDFNNFTSDVLIEFVCNDLKLLKRFLETCDWDYYSDFEDYLKDKFFEEIKEQAIKDTEEDEDEIAPLQREFDILNR